MTLIGTCSICSEPAMYSCSICGQVVCVKCYIKDKRMCVNCSGGVEDDEEAPQRGLGKDEIWF